MCLLASGNRNCKFAASSDSAFIRFSTSVKRVHPPMAHDRHSPGRRVAWHAEFSHIQLPSSEQFTEKAPNSPITVYKIDTIFSPYRHLDVQTAAIHRSNSACKLVSWLAGLDDTKSKTSCSIALIHSHVCICFASNYMRIFSIFVAFDSHADFGQ